MRIDSSYLVAVLAGVMLAGFLPHTEWVFGWAGILALIITSRKRTGCKVDERFRLVIQAIKNGSHDGATHTKIFSDIV